MSETQDALENSELLAYDYTSASVPVLKADNVRFLSEIVKTAKNNRKSYLDATQENKGNEDIIDEDEIKNLFSFRRSFADLDSKYRLQIFDKIKNSGILALIEQVGGIREFSRKRFSNDEFLRRISF